MPNATPSLTDATRLDLNKLRTFFVIAESGGVSAAARRLALTRSAVSHSLAGLEASLGTPLFLRVGKRLELTQAGRRLRAAYAEAEVRIDDALSEIVQDEQIVRGTLRLGLFLGFSRVRLSGVIERFLAAHAHARVRVVYGSSRELAEQLAAGRLDVSLSLRAAKGAEGGQGITSTRLFEQNLVLAARQRPRGRVDAFETLSALPFIDYFRQEPLIDRWMRFQYGRKRIARDRIRVYVGSSSDLALELACRGVGCCVLPLDLVEPYRERGELTVIRGPKGPLRDPIWLNRSAAARPNAATRALTDALLAERS
jgi:LysR family transcriptional activator of glutamate synthase operon